MVPDSRCPSTPRNAKVDSDGPKAGWKCVGSTMTCNNKHHSHTTASITAIPREEMTIIGMVSVTALITVQSTVPVITVITVPTIHRRIVATSPASTLAMEEEMEEVIASGVEAHDYIMKEIDPVSYDIMASSYR